MSRAENPPRAVVDTNLFVSALIAKRGIPHDLLLRWRGGAFRLLISEEQRAELADVLARPAIRDRYHLAAEEIGAFFLLLDTLSLPAFGSRRLPVHVRDPRDDHILAAALGGQADYVVSGDHDLLDLDGDPGLGTLRIVTAAAFAELLPRSAPD